MCFFFPAYVVHNIVCVWVIVLNLNLFVFRKLENKNKKYTNHSRIVGDEGKRKRHKKKNKQNKTTTT